MTKKEIEFAQLLVGAWQKENGKPLLFFEEPDLDELPNWKTMVHDDIEDKFVSKEVQFYKIAPDIYRLFFKKGLDVSDWLLQPIDDNSINLIIKIADKEFEWKLVRIDDVESVFK